MSGPHDMATTYLHEQESRHGGLSVDAPSVSQQVRKQRRGRRRWTWAAIALALASIPVGIWLL